MEGMLDLHGLDPDPQVSTFDSLENTFSQDRHTDEPLMEGFHEVLIQMFVPAGTPTEIHPLLRRKYRLAKYCVLMPADIASALVL